MTRVRIAHVALLLAAVALAACTATVIRPAAGTRSATSPPRTGGAAAGAGVVVQRGDTLHSIATRNGVSTQALAAANGLSPPYTIYPGQRLRLPGSGRPVATRPPASKPPAAPAATPPATTPRPASPPRTLPAPSTPPSSSGIAWRWPAQGALIGRFAAGDPTRQGIDIAGKAGDAVRAAADGTVVYSGAGLVGYGELVIVKHSDAWLSAYGHNRRRLVNEGELVKAGQQIAEMGRSGAAREMLHFEIRYNGKPVDPLVYLPPQG